MFQWLGSTNDPMISRRLIWTGDWSPWQQALIIGACVLILGLTIWNYRNLYPIRRRVGLLALRTSILALLLFLFFQPALVEERVQKSRNTVVVLVDGLHETSS